MKPTIWMAISLAAILGCGDAPPAKTAAVAPTKLGGDSLPPPTSVDSTNQSKSAASGSPYIIPPPPVAATAGTTGPIASALEDIDLDGFELTIASLKGRVVAVDAWATWCVPCRAKFPKFVEIAKKHAGEKIAFVSLAIEESAPEKAREFLKTSGADFLNLRLANVPSAAWQKRLGFAAVPHYLLYDATGKLAFHSEKLEELESKLAELRK